MQSGVAPHAPKRNRASHRGVQSGRQLSNPTARPPRNSAAGTGRVSQRAGGVAGTRAAGRAHQRFRIFRFAGASAGGVPSSSVGATGGSPSLESSTGMASAKPGTASCRSRARSLSSDDTLQRLGRGLRLELLLRGVAQPFGTTACCSLDYLQVRSSSDNAKGVCFLHASRGYKYYNASQLSLTLWITDSIN